MGGFIIIVVEMGLNRGPGQPPGQQGDHLLQHDPAPDGHWD